MIKEFEGKSEKEAIDNAVAELNLDREQFDVEIMESTKGGIFRKGNVKIRVYLQGESRAPEAKPATGATGAAGNKAATGNRAARKPAPKAPKAAAAERTEARSGFPAGGGSTTDPQPQDEFERKLIEFI